MVKRDSGREREPMIKLKPLAVSLFIALGTGGFAALLTQGAMERYREL